MDIGSVSRRNLVLLAAVHGGKIFLSFGKFKIFNVNFTCPDKAFVLRLPLSYQPTHQPFIRFLL